MKILVLSDSHASLRFMRHCIDKYHPDSVIHLGDYYEDADILQEDYPEISFHLLAGNCDRYRCPAYARETLCYCVGGVKLFMTHGHKYHVKSGIGALLAEARRSDAAAALYGHTHQADCHQEEDGLWVLNPGSCGHSGGSAGILETDGKNITACRVVQQAEWEEFV